MLIFFLAAREENSSDTRKTWARGTETGAVRKTTRNGGTVEAEDGGSDAGEEAQPGTQGIHISPH